MADKDNTLILIGVGSLGLLGIIAYLMWTSKATYAPIYVPQCTEV